MNEEFFEFLRKSPTCFQAVDNIKTRLLGEGFIELSETDDWNIVPNGKYFVTRNNSSIIALKLPKGKPDSFKVCASHSDSPAFKVKASPEIAKDDMFVKINVERYGGALLTPWFDRPLSIAGRITVQEDGVIAERLFNVERDIFMIPSLCIHFDRSANEGHKIEVQKEMLPIFGDISEKGRFMDFVADEAGVSKEDILGIDLFLYNRDEPLTWGAKNEFIGAPRIDDLQCTYADLIGFIKAEPDQADDSLLVYSVFDNEEVGSRTKQGADSTFLSDVLERVCEASDMTKSNFKKAVAKSFMISADNAHAYHPNYGDKYDINLRPKLNGGIVIKYNASQKYSTDAVSAAVMKTVCNKAGVPFQEFANNSDIAGGSTLGNILNSTFPVDTVDIGLPQLAMHSPFESAGAFDTDYLIKAVETFYSSRIEKNGDGIRVG